MIRPDAKDKADVFSDTWESLTKMVSKGDSGDSDWYGCDREELVAKMTNPAPGVALDAEKEFDKFLDLMLPEQMDLVLDRDTSPVGATPCVPAFISGRPDSMWRGVWDEAPPLCRIYVQANCHASTKPEDQRTRGMLCAAFAYAVQTRQPVELFWFALNSGYSRKGPRTGHKLSAIRLGTAPLDMSRVATLFGEIGIFRHSMERRRYAFGGYSKLKPEEVLEIGPDDIVIPALHHNDLERLREDPLHYIRGVIQDQENARLSTQERSNR